MGNLVSISLHFSDIFHSFLMFSLIFMNIQIIFLLTTNHEIKVLCLSITVVSSLVLKGNCQLRYELFCKYTPLTFSAIFHYCPMFSLKFMNIQIIVCFHICP